MSRVQDRKGVFPPAPLADEQGLIPEFGPVKTDELNRIVMSEEEREARRAAALRLLAVFDQLPDDDPTEVEEEMMRGIDAARPSYRKLFERYY